ncbi:hypothetical protein PG995_014813 [Apiospora arundinis]
MSGFSCHASSASAVKQEDPNAELQSSQPIQRYQRAADTLRGYDWEHALRTATKAMHEEGIRELPPSRVRRVMLEDKLIHLFDVNPYGVRDFITYDGYDVLACVQDPALIYDVLYQLASLHVGKLAGSDHPDDIDLDVQAERMKASEGKSRGWAILMRPTTIPNKTARQEAKSDRNRAGGVTAEAALPSLQAAAPNRLWCQHTEAIASNPVEQRALLSTATSFSELAALHIGKKVQSAHPEDLSLAIKSEKMTDDDDRFAGWATLIQPAVLPGTKRKADNNQRSKFQKRQVQR